MSPPGQPQVGAILVGLILAVTLLHLAAFLAAHALGGSNAGAVPMGHDLFADFFKYILSFPGGGDVLGCLVALKAMAWIEPALLFAALLAALTAWWVRIVARFADDRNDAARWATTGLLCYPAAVVLLRGNLYAGIAGLLIVQAMLSARRRCCS